IVVNDAGDLAGDPVGVVSLRDAVSLANTYNAYHHDITFGAGLAGHPIVLNQVIPITSNMAVTGLGAASTTITTAGNPPGAVFEVAVGQTVVLSALTVAGGLTVDTSAAGGTVAVSDAAVGQGSQSVTFPNSVISVLTITVPGGGTVNVSVNDAGDF